MVEKERRKGRERIIRDIETIEQAIKAEKDVEIGYHNAIEENVLFWIATEEDIIESYSKLLNGTDNKKIKDTFTKIIEDSKNHVLMLTEIRKSFSRIASDEQRHARMLEGLKGEVGK